MDSVVDQGQQEPDDEDGRVAFSLDFPDVDVTFGEEADFIDSEYEQDLLAFLKDVEEEHKSQQQVDQVDQEDQEDDAFPFGSRPDISMDESKDDGGGFVRDLDGPEIAGTAQFPHAQFEAFAPSEEEIEGDEGFQGLDQFEPVNIRRPLPTKIPSKIPEDFQIRDGPELNNLKQFPHEIHLEEEGEEGILTEEEPRQTLGILSVLANATAAAIAAATGSGNAAGTTNSDDEFEAVLSQVQEVVEDFEAAGASGCQEETTTCSPVCSVEEVTVPLEILETVCSTDHCKSKGEKSFLKGIIDKLGLFGKQECQEDCRTLSKTMETVKNREVCKEVCSKACVGKR